MPFGGNLDNPVHIYNAVFKHQLIFSAEFEKMPAAKALIRKLLSIQPYARGTIHALKNHDWFASTNWDQILLRKHTPEYLPTVKKLDAEVSKAFSTKKSARLR